MTVNSAAIAVLLISFLVMIFLRFPIAYAVAISSILCLLYQGQSLTTVCQQMVKGISSFSLMAVPFFITMGCLMGSDAFYNLFLLIPRAMMRGFLFYTFSMSMISVSRRSSPKNF